MHVESLHSCGGSVVKGAGTWYLILRAVFSTQRSYERSPMVGAASIQQRLRLLFMLMHSMFPLVTLAWLPFNVLISVAGGVNIGHGQLSYVCGEM